jgi:hypothetical protein
MPVMDADVAADLQWKALEAIINAETASGKRLDGIKYVGSAYTLWTRTPPAIGVQLKSTSFEPYASNRRLMTTSFWIIVAAQSTDESATARFGDGDPDKTVESNVEDAMDALRPFIADGTGNGLMAVLYDGANYTLSNTAMQSFFTALDYDWESGPGKPPENWAYARIIHTAKQLVNVIKGAA